MIKQLQNSQTAAVRNVFENIFLTAAIYFVLSASQLVTCLLFSSFAGRKSKQVKYIHQTIQPSIYF